MINSTIALFGESEKGDFHTGYYCTSLDQVVDCLGNAPPDTQGLYYATQVLLFQKDLLFFRVHEEGFSVVDYFKGLEYLQGLSLQKMHPLAAICAPGVGSDEIIEDILSLCTLYNSIFLTNEADLYDYLAIRPRF